METPSDTAPALGPALLGRLLLSLSRGVNRLRDLLCDPHLTRFIVVSRAAALPRAETARLVRQLRRLEVPVTALVVNAFGRGSCAPCRRAAAAERRELAALRSSPGMRTLPCLLMPTHLPAPQGAAALEAWADTVRGC